MAVDNIDWVATEKVVKVIQLRDSIPEETLAVLKKMLKGFELAPSLISLSVSALRTRLLEITLVPRLLFVSPCCRLP